MSPIEETVVVNESIQVEVPEVQELDFNNKGDITTIKNCPVILLKSGKLLASKVEKCTKSVIRLRVPGYTNCVVVKTEGVTPYLFRDAVVLLGEEVKEFYTGPTED